MSEELKPCPFCGSRAWISQREDKHSRYYVACQGKDCWAAMGENYDPDGMPDHRYYTQEQAIEAWNLRSEPAGKETK